MDPLQQRCAWLFFREIHLDRRRGITLVPLELRGVACKSMHGRSSARLPVVNADRSMKQVYLAPADLDRLAKPEPTVGRSVGGRKTGVVPDSACKCCNAIHYNRKNCKICVASQDIPVVLFGIDVSVTC